MRISGGVYLQRFGSVWYRYRSPANVLNIVSDLNTVVL
jgi:hypothetical protein